MILLGMPLSDETFDIRARSDDPDVSQPRGLADDCRYLTSNLALLGAGSVWHAGCSSAQLKRMNARHGDGWRLYSFQTPAEAQLFPGTTVVSASATELLRRRTSLLLDDRMSRYPFPRQHVPPLSLLPLIVCDMTNYLLDPLHPEGVAVLFDPGEYGRAGLLASAYLLARPELSSELTQLGLTPLRKKDLAPSHEGERVDQQQDASFSLPDAASTPSLLPGNEEIAVPSLVISDWPHFSSLETRPLAPSDPSSAESVPQRTHKATSTLAARRLSGTSTHPPSAFTRFSLQNGTGRHRANRSAPSLHSNRDAGVAPAPSPEALPAKYEVAQARLQEVLEFYAKKARPATSPATFSGPRRFSAATLDKAKNWAHPSCRKPAERAHENSASFGRAWDKLKRSQRQSHSALASRDNRKDEPRREEGQVAVYSIASRGRRQGRRAFLTLRPWTSLSPIPATPLTPRYNDDEHQHGGQFEASTFGERHISMTEAEWESASAKQTNPTDASNMVQKPGYPSSGGTQHPIPGDTAVISPDSSGRVPCRSLGEESIVGVSLFSSASPTAQTTSTNLERRDECDTTADTIAENQEGNPLYRSQSVPVKGHPHRPPLIPWSSAEGAPNARLSGTDTVASGTERMLPPSHRRWLGYWSRVLSGFDPRRAVRSVLPVPKRKIILTRVTVEWEVLEATPELYAGEPPDQTCLDHASPPNACASEYATDGRRCSGCLASGMGRMDQVKNELLLQIGASWSSARSKIMGMGSTERKNNLWTISPSKMAWRSNASRSFTAGGALTALSAGISVAGAPAGQVLTSSMSPAMAKGSAMSRVEQLPTIQLGQYEDEVVTHLEQWERGARQRHRAWGAFSPGDASYDLPLDMPRTLDDLLAAEAGESQDHRLSTSGPEDELERREALAHLRAHLFSKNFMGINVDVEAETARQFMQDEVSVRWFTSLSLLGRTATTLPQSGTNHLSPAYSSSLGPDASDCAFSSQEQQGEIVRHDVVSGLPLELNAERELCIKLTVPKSGCLAQLTPSTSAPSPEARVWFVPCFEEGFPLPAQVTTIRFPSGEIDSNSPIAGLHAIEAEWRTVDSHLFNLEEVPML